MACRCNDIAGCKADIEDLKTAKGYLTELITLDTQVEQGLTAVVGYSQSAFTTKNLDQLEGNEKKVNDQVTSTLSNILTRIETEITTLETQSLVELEREDKQTHQEEKKDEA